MKKRLFLGLMFAAIAAHDATAVVANNPGPPAAPPGTASSSAPFTGTLSLIVNSVSCDTGSVPPHVPLGYGEARLVGTVTGIPPSGFSVGQSVAVVFFLSVSSDVTTPGDTRNQICVDIALTAAANQAVYAWQFTPVAGPSLGSIGQTFNVTFNVQNSGGQAVVQSTGIGAMSCSLLPIQSLGGTF